MPTYEYACRDCGHHLEVVQSFRDERLTECPRCEGSLRKVFSPAGIIFKGSGYYVTDTRAEQATLKNGSSSERSEAASDGGGEGSSSSSSEAASGSGETAASGTGSGGASDAKGSESAA